MSEFSGPRGQINGRRGLARSDRDKWIARAIRHFVARNEFPTTQKFLLRFFPSQIHITTFFYFFYSVWRFVFIMNEFIPLRPASKLIAKSTIAIVTFYR